MAVSQVGAKGLGQVMPMHFKACGMSNPFDWKQNMTCSAGILADALKTSHGGITEALVRYNGGGAAWEAWKAGRPYRESVGYVNSVMKYYKEG
jgi:soluble lytic murein transglycosylase-like protein